ncbi:KAP family NTPase [Shewanella spartinae]|uniref:KAP family NTPase n=1 Tax=Shewanella spartinae TaxID=2864205 RepID=UPI001C65C6F8|nr:KAP family NTPase [Shewanella spartinae]QYJ94896.1 KAP family NTPase [Shewanella spartinae]
MNIEEFSASFRNYLLDENENVLLVKGQWGIGKTHYIDSSLEENKEHYKYVKVSLFGLDNIDELSRAVSESLINNFISPAVSKLGKAVASVPFITKFIPKELPSFDDVTIDSSITRFVIFFDDIERMTLSLQEFFGYVDRLKNSSPFKIVIALNDKQLKDQEIWKLKEKVTDRELRLKDTLEHVIGNIFSQDSELALYIFRQLKVVNLRVIIKSSVVMDLFVNKSEGLDNENLTRLKVSCLCLSAKYYASEDFDESRFENVSQYDRYFSFNSLINSYLDSQVITDELFNNKNRFIVNRQIENDNDEAFKTIIEMFENTFCYNSQELLRLSGEFVKRPSLNESQLIFIVNVIHKLGGLVSSETIEYWFNVESKSQWFIRDLLSVFESGDTYEEILQYQEQEDTTSEDDNTDVSSDETSSFIAAYLIQSNNSNLKYFEDDLSVYSKDDWMNYISSHDPVNLFRKIQDGIFQFIEEGKGENLKQALIEISIEPIQRMRLVNIFGTRINNILN